jgi:hypothetical protein
MLNDPAAINQDPPLWTLPNEGRLALSQKLLGGCLTY